MKLAATAYDQQKVIEAAQSQEFDFSSRYNTLLLVLTIAMFFMLTMPATTPFALLAFVMYYLCDKYLILYVHSPPASLGRRC